MSFLCSWISRSKSLMLSTNSSSFVSMLLMSSRCTSMSLLRALNFFFMIPFSPLNRSVASRSAFSFFSYFSFRSSISVSISSSSWPVVSSYTRPSSSRSSAWCIRAWRSSSNFCSYSSVISAVYCSWLPIRSRCCWSQRCC